MPYNQPRDPNADSASGSASGYPIARGFACTVLLALGVLILLRYFFGSIRVEAGVK
jgi:hypothetical protein